MSETRPDDATVERVAEAICRANGVDWDRCFSQGEYLRIARAALAASGPVEEGPGQVWFHVDPNGDGMVEHATEAEAVDAATSCIGMYLDDTWSEDVEGVHVGTITHRASRHVVARRSDMTEEQWAETWGRDDVDEIWDYPLIRVGTVPPLHAPVGDGGGHDQPAEPTLALIAAQSLANSCRWFPEVHGRGHEATTTHLTYGIGGEAGEVIDVVKKVDICGGLMDQCDMHKPGKHSRQALEDEMADLLTYLLALAEHEGVDLAAAWARKQAECEERWG